MKIRRILYPTDFSTCSRQALPHALFLAEQFGAELHMLHAVVLHEYDPNRPEAQFPESKEILQHLFQIAETEMSAIAQSQEGKSLEIREATRRGFRAAEVILDYARANEIDVVVMGTHGRGRAARFFLGSVAAEVVRLATCPVMTLREMDEPRQVEAIENILVPIDFSAHSRRALRVARTLAALYDARVQLLHVIEQPPAPYFYSNVGGGLSVAKELAELEAKSDATLHEFFGGTDGPQVPFETFVLTGRPASRIIEFAEEKDSDMVVIATHGLTGVERLLVGSTAEQVIHRVPGPVFTVKSYGKSLVSDED